MNQFTPPPGSLPELPPMPGMRQRRGGPLGWYDGLPRKKKAAVDNIFFYIGIFLFLLLPSAICGSYFLIGFGSEEEPVAEATTEPVEIDLQATITAMQAVITTTTTTLTTTDSISPTPAIQPLILSPGMISATATAHFLYNQPAIVPADYDDNKTGRRLLVGSIRLDGSFGFCEYTNIGLLAGGSPYFLDVQLDQLPEADINSNQLQVVGVIQAADSCDYPLLKVLDARWIGIATPEPFDPQGMGRGGGTYTTTHRPTPANVPQVAPTPANDYLAQYPYNGPDGQPLPTVTPQTAPVNLFGQTTAIADCPDSNFGLATSGGEFVLLFAGANMPTGDSPFGQNVYVQGDKLEICGRAGIRATSATYTASQSPSGGSASQSPSYSRPGGYAVPTATKTPKPTSTPVRLVASGRFVEAVGCDVSVYGLEGNERFYYLSLSTINLPETGSSIIVSGYLEDECGEILRVSEIATITPTPKPKFEPVDGPDW